MFKASGYIKLLISLTLIISIFSLATQLLYNLNKQHNLLYHQQSTTTQINSLLNRLTFELKSSKKILTNNFPANNISYLNADNETKTLQIKNKRLARIGTGTSYLTNKSINFISFKVTKPQAQTYQLIIKTITNKHEQEFKRSISLIND